MILVLPRFLAYFLYIFDMQWRFFLLHNSLELFVFCDLLLPLKSDFGFGCQECVLLGQMTVDKI